MTGRHQSGLTRAHPANTATRPTILAGPAHSQLPSAPPNVTHTRTRTRPRVHVHTRRYEFRYKQAVESTDMFLGMSGKDESSTSCEDLVVRITLPEVSSISGGWPQCCLGLWGAARAWAQLLAPHMLTRLYYMLTRLQTLPACALAAPQSWTWMSRAPT